MIIALILLEINNLEYLMKLKQYIGKISNIEKIEFLSVKEALYKFVYRQK